MTRLLIYTLNATGALEEYKEAGRSVMKSLKARLLTAVVGISIILVLLFLGEIQPLVIAFAVAAVTAFMTGEYLHANKLLKKYFISVPCILFAAVIPIVLNTGLVYPIIAVFMIVGFAMLIYNHKQINYLDFVVLINQAINIENEYLDLVKQINTLIIELQYLSVSN